MLAGKRSGIIHVGLALVLLFSLLLSACGEGESPAPAQTETSSTAEPPVAGLPAAEPPAAEAPAGEQPAAQVPVSEPARSIPQGESGTWLVLLYQDADDEVLERDIYLDLNEAEIVGSTDQVTIVSQIDRLAGGFDGGDDSTTAKRYLVTQDDDLENLASQELEDLGEVDMSDPQTLVDFAVWAIQSYPADKVALILSDHGAGWQGGWTDNDPTEGGLMPMEIIDQALAAIIEQTGIGQFEMVGFDACLMAQVETLTAIAPHARYSVASEEVEPAVGWAYASFLDALTQNPAMSGAELGQVIVDGYIEQDYRVVDEEARGNFAEELGAGRGVSAEELAAGLGNGVTLSAIDLSQMAAVNMALNDLALVLEATDPSVTSAARAYAQSYETVFGKESEPSFIDLGHFAALAAEESGDEQVQAAVQAVQDAIQQAVLAEKHGPQRPGSTGISFFFPNAELYGQTFITFENGPYTQFVSRFAAASLWDDFLTAFYTGSQIDPAGADLAVLEPTFPSENLAALTASSNPASGATSAAPTGSEIIIQPLELSADEISVDGTVSINTSVSGSNVAFLYIYSIYYDEVEDALMTADISFVNAENSKTVGGVTFPDWGDSGEIPISVEWQPTLYYISDGNQANDQFALFNPDTYGATFEEDVFTVYGQYSSGSREPREAMLEFAGTGEMRALWVFSDQNTGPRQVAPRPGDTFTMWNEWMENNQEDFTYYPGGTMTFGDTPFTINPYTAFPGLYVIGIVAMDFDGNTVSEFTEVTVTP